METRRVRGGIGALASMGLLLCASSETALAVPDCCSNVTTENSTRSDVLGNDFCASSWFSTQRAVGKFCLPLGSGYACGIQNTLTVGQEFTLTAGFTIGGDVGGVSVEAATTYSVSQAFQHTAGPCQSCQLYASYPNAVLRQWDVTSFYFYGKSQKKRTTFYPNGAPTIMPCCEVNTNCPGCRVGGDGNDESGSAWFEADPIRSGIAGGPDRAGLGIGPEGSYIVDLRDPDFTFFGGLPPWHPMLSPGMSLADLNGWQKRQIMREVRWMETIQGGPLAELVIFDLDGTPAFFNLAADPAGIVPCDADLNCDAVLDLADVGLFINYFLFMDVAVDYDATGVIDLGDIGIFIGSFLSGCP